jgi:hypothetical protein
VFWDSKKVGEHEPIVGVTDAILSCIPLSGV